MEIWSTLDHSPLIHPVRIFLSSDLTPFGLFCLISLPTDFSFDWFLLRLISPPTDFSFDWFLSLLISPASLLSDLPTDHSLLPASHYLLSLRVTFAAALAVIYSSKRCQLSIAKPSISPPIELYPTVQIQLRIQRPGLSLRLLDVNQQSTCIQLDALGVVLVILCLKHLIQ